jgi:hypothetical protein
MADHPRFMLFHERFETAMQSYRKTTGVALTEHSLALQSNESITAILKHEAQAYNYLLGTDQIMKSIENTVPVLSSLFSTASIGEATGPVHQNALMACCTSLTGFFTAIPPCESHTCWPYHPVCCVSVLLFMCLFDVTFELTRPPSI